MLRFTALAIVLLALAACGPANVQADVTRFTTLTPTEAARSFTILPDQSQKGSLEFQQYADLVANELVQRGWRPLPASDNNAQAVVMISWGLGPPHTIAWQSPSAVWTSWGWGGPWYGGGIYQPFPYYETEVSTTWPQWVSVEILDGQAWRMGKTRIALFEGRAVTEGTRPAIAPTMPYLVRALFNGFPGTSGQTVHVEVPVAH